jgi:hypothetical protein
MPVCYFKPVTTYKLERRREALKRMARPSGVLAY